MGGSKGRGRKAGGAGRRPEEDREALERAYANVKPLRGASRRRVSPGLDLGSAQGARPEAPREPSSEALRVERERNGIVVGRRRAAHPSILDALEDPRLEVQSECDLHGHTSREARREVLRFVRERQQAGQRWVLIIVGKGLHSPGGKATLQSSIVDALSSGAPARFVLAFRTAPRHLGGTGALVVRLLDRL